ncbi:MAG: hypothetical protein J5I98_05135 [Phaeodactylibacter sp.]|nr:hypothetical protein [Phaeodactylibacter sp.]
MNNQKIKVSIVANDLSDAVKEEMWAVYRNYYHYTRDSFMARIAGNNYYSFYTLNGKIIGFTGLRISRAVIDSKKHLFIYFGQTVIDKAHRGKSLIPVTGARLYLMFWREILSSRTFFWADALTYKAYLVFAKSLEEFYPTYQQKNPQHIQKVIDYIGQEHYGKDYNFGLGTVSKDQVLVNDPCASIPLKYRKDPDIRFYVQANPGYTRGQGLITLAPLSGTNFMKLARRLMMKAVKASLPVFFRAERKGTRLAGN